MTADTIRGLPEALRAAAEPYRKVRLEGGGDVHKAVRAAGVNRYVVQSTGFFYGPGPGLAVETDPLAVSASPGVAGSVQTYTEIKKRVLGSREMEGVALRYGFFYGPEPITIRRPGVSLSRCDSKNTR